MLRRLAEARPGAHHVERGTARAGVLADKRALARAVQDVEKAAEEDAVMLERELHLGPRAVQVGDAARKCRRAVGRDKAADQLELFVGHLWMPLADSLDVDQLRSAQ